MLFDKIYVYLTVLLFNKSTTISVVTKYILRALTYICVSYYVFLFVLE